GSDDSTISGLLDVATRNEDANYVILTGEYPPGVDADLPWTGENAEELRNQTLERLYSHDWGDDGEAVRGITDWLVEGPADGDTDTDGVLRETAMMSLMELMVNEEFQDSVFNTGSHVTDEDGTTWDNVSTGQLHPEIADGCVDLFIAFQDEFANTDGLPDNVPLGHGDGAEFTPEARVAFAQLAAGDPDAAARMYTEALHQTAETMEDYSTNTGDRTYKPIHEAASLQGLVEVALLNESTTRETNNEEFVDYRKKVDGAVINVLGGGAGDGGVSALIVEFAKVAAGEAFEVSGDPAEPHVEVNGDWAKTEQMMGYALGVAAEQDPELMEELKEDGIAQEDGHGGFYIPPDHSDWGISSSDSVLSDYYHDIDGNVWPDGEGDVRGAVQDFVDKFEMTGEKWERFNVN